MSGDTAMSAVHQEFHAALHLVEERLRGQGLEEGKGGVYSPKQVVGLACKILLDTLLSNQSAIQAEVAATVREHRLDSVEARTLGDATADVLEVLRGKARNAPT